MVKFAQSFLALVVFCFLASCIPTASETPLASTQPVTATTTPQLASSPTLEPTFTSSPTPSNAPDLTGETIVLIHLCDRTGPFSAAHASRIQAVSDAVVAINENGGIFGATLDLQLTDTLGTDDGAIRALARMVRQQGESPLYLICDPVAEGAISNLLRQDELPALAPGIFSEDEGYIFALDATPQEHFIFFVKQLSASWGDWQPEGALDEIRVAVVAWPPELVGSLDSDQFDPEVANIVMDIELAASADTNVFDLIYQARDVNANVIYTNARGFGLANLLNALQVLGLRERFVVAAPASSFDAQTIEYLADPTYATGLFLTSTWPWGADSAQPGDWGYLQFSAGVAVARRALELAILDEGFENLSPETVLAALEDMDGYPVLNGLFLVDYSGGDRSLKELHVWRVGAEPDAITSP